MNLFFEQYSNDKFHAGSHNNTIDFGFTQLEKLYYFLGFPRIDDMKAHLRSSYEYIEFKKGTQLIRKGDSCNSLFFIISGSTRIFTYTVDNYEQVFLLSNEGNIATSVTSFLKNQPSDIFMETCQKTKMLVLKKDRFEQIMQSELNPSYLHLLYSLNDKSLYYQKKLTSMLYMNSKEKLDYLYNSFPDIFNSFAVKHIASLSGIKPETLSRIRKTLA